MWNRIRHTGRNSFRLASVGLKPDLQEALEGDRSHKSVPQLTLSHWPSVPDARICFQEAQRQGRLCARATWTYLCPVLKTNCGGRHADGWHDLFFVRLGYADAPPTRVPSRVG